MKQERPPQIPENVIYYSEKEGSKNAALIFSGQGVQEVGMGRDLYDAYPQVKNLYDKANLYLCDLLDGRSLLDLTEEELKRTDFAQPAIFVYNEACRIAFIKRRKERGEKPIKPKFYAGNSFGIFNALLAAGAYSFKDGLHLVAARAKLMQRACEKIPGGLILVQASITKENLTVLKDFGLSEAIIYDTRVVLGGTDDNLNKALVWLEKKDEKNIWAKRLNVAGAFHTPLMKTAEEPLKRFVGEMRKSERIKELKTPVIASTTAESITQPWQIGEEIINSLTKPVLWKQTIDFLEKQGVAGTVELGNKNVLSNLMKNRGKIIAGTGGMAALGLAAFLLFRRQGKK